MFGRIKISNNIMSLVLLLLVLSHVSFYQLLRTDFGTSDDGSYISHVMSFSLDNDKDYSNEIAKRRTVDGIYPSHSFGGALVTYPFTKIGGILDNSVNTDVVENRSQTPFSFTFLLLLLAKIFMFYTCIQLVSSIQPSSSGEIQKQKTTLGYVLFGAAGYYFFQRFTMVHAEEMFMASVVLFASFKMHKLRNSLYPLVLTLAIILSLLIKASNLPVVLFPFLVAMILKSSLRAYLKISMIVIIGVILTELSKYFFYGVYPVSPAYLFGRSIEEVRQLPDDTIGKFTFLIENFQSYFKILVSYEYGLIFTNPILAAAIFVSLISLLVLKFDKLWFYLIYLLCAGFSLSIVVFWQSNGTDYGYRYLLYLLPLSYIIISNSGISPNYFLPLIFLSVIFSLLYKANDQLTPGPGINSFNRYELTQNNDYIFDILSNILHYEVWVVSFGKGLFGAFTVYLPDKITQSLESIGGAKYTVLITHFENSPKTYTAWLLSIVIFTTLLHVWVLHKKDNCHD